jgi:hypothetical protein
MKENNHGSRRTTQQQRKEKAESCKTSGWSRDLECLDQELYGPNQQPEEKRLSVKKKGCNQRSNRRLTDPLALFKKWI